MSVLIGIGSLELPDNIIVIKPDYVSLGISLLLEFYILYIVKTYVKIKIEKVIEIKKEAKKEKKRRKLFQINKFKQAFAIKAANDIER